ncbi:hypothetical protein LCY76_07480 [Fictibacillus sp. KIGAM418]|uniref:Uncharacterized protein n=1 Tax=Fictibacillus marinisediminis TaxID=2878389 RepID=A0A9X1XBN0_9BACL|nr:hypothetical protein [Fictibacillus marinisediminis]MCK6256433.1 hypothetical protein [Fictibacillus marinisediminis]
MKQKGDSLYKVWICLFVLTIFIGLLTVWIDVAWVKKTLWSVLLLFSMIAATAMYPGSGNSAKKHKDNVTSIYELKKKKSRRKGM